MTRTHASPKSSSSTQKHLRKEWRGRSGSLDFLHKPDLTRIACNSTDSIAAAAAAAATTTSTGSSSCIPRSPSSPRFTASLHAAQRRRRSSAARLGLTVHTHTHTHAQSHTAPASPTDIASPTDEAQMFSTILIAPISSRAARVSPFGSRAPPRRQREDSSSSSSSVANNKDDDDDAMSCNDSFTGSPPPSVAASDSAMSSKSKSQQRASSRSASPMAPAYEARTSKSKVTSFGSGSEKDEKKSGGMGYESDEDRGWVLHLLRDDEERGDLLHLPPSYDSLTKEEQRARPMLSSSSEASSASASASNSNPSRPSLLARAKAARKAKHMAKVEAAHDAWQAYGLDTRAMERSGKKMPPFFLNPPKCSNVDMKKMLREQGL
ncbi:hypothetical protein IE81DRAFT_96927 [Ceraceosorus guamensis]|uniref:Uncharacterized protein n=1 Tax=Ceraceosorus guamensis TaxID=1522189 RepID=A0A316VMY0_9BASI|nr:hypothetical protein IE81DRAFT_96927 [Ceraceosorus guamensis]PWN38670.1 hypothetical protein IE81DRAFT_96927 [Ceraceosorus guamensis]